MAPERMTIGRFSEMTRLSIRALRLYDRLGLLVPDRVDPQTGYRTYVPGQANRAEAIRILRSVDMPLEEIRAVLAVDDVGVVRDHLHHHRRRLADRLAHQEHMLTFLEGLINGEEPIMPYDISLEQAPPQHVLALRSTVDHESISSDIAGGFARLGAHLGAVDAQPVAPPFIIFHDLIDEQTPGDIELCFPVAGPVEGDGEVQVRHLPGSDVATTMHRGRYSEITPAYHALSTWMDERGHVVAGPPREIYLNDPREVGEADQLTQVQWPVGGGAAS